jgi:signal transduction histidine kinase
MIRITDNGPGIAPEVQSQLFDPFFTTKPIGKGTGLGLSISHQIVVENHGGILRCESTPGKGTEFWIELPLQVSRVYPPSNQLLWLYKDEG